MSAKYIRTVFAAIMGVLCLSTLVVAQEEAREAAAKTHAVALAAWADQTLGQLYNGGHISGAVVSIVKDGELLLAKGYGQSDIVAGTEADPAKTRARIGSTTKTFTATIIAQLMAEGKIASLDDPANKYLKRYQLPDNAGKVITLKHLLTHTAGFEDKFFFIGSDRPVEIPVVAELYDSLRPAFARPVEEKAVYSNFGVATLGLVIEDITGLPIHKAMQSRIFEPAGMRSTSLVVDIDEPEGLAVPGLISAQGTVGPVPFKAINPAVAQTGSIVSTAEDMARYMNTQMEGWPSYGADLQELLFTRIAGNHADIGGLGMVFFIDNWAGRKTVSHGGNWPGFHTWMTLVPEERLGFYVTLFGDVAPEGLGTRFLRATIPSLAPPPSPAKLSALSLHSAFLQAVFGDKREMLASVAADFSSYTGSYRADRRAYHSAEAVSSLVYFGADMLAVTAKEDGLYLNGGGPFRHVGEGRFMLDVPGRPTVTFTENNRTGDMYLSHDLGIYTFTKAPAVMNTKAHAILLHVLIPLCVLALFVALVLKVWRYRAPALIVGGSALLMVLLSTLGLGAGESLITPYFAGYTGRITAFSFACNALLVGAVWSLVVTLRAEGWRGKLMLGTPGLLASAAVLLLLPYNLLGWPSL